GPTAARRIADDPDALHRLLHDELADRGCYAGELRRTVADQQGIGRWRRLLMVHDTYGSVARDLPRQDPALSTADIGVTVLHLVADRLHEPEQVAVRLTVNGPDVTVEDLRGAAPVVVTGRLDQASPALAEGLARLLAPLRLSPDSEQDAGQSG